MSLDILNEYLASGDLSQDSLARRFASSYRWSRGYGPEAGKILKGVSKGKDWRVLNKNRFKDGSYGNGAAMRSPVLALLYGGDSQALDDIIKAVSEITHCNPIAIDSAIFTGSIVADVIAGFTVCESIKSAAAKMKTTEFREVTERLLEDIQGSPLTLREIKKSYGTGVIATQSVPAAVYLSYLHRSDKFESLLDSCRMLGGDADTMGAISGAIWGASNGFSSIPESCLCKVEDIGEIKNICNRVYEELAAKSKKRSTREL